MSVSYRNGVLEIRAMRIENPLISEYVESLPSAERETAIVRALGIGVMAELKGEIGHFLNETEGTLGKHLSTLKAIYDLRTLRFQTSGKGADAEQQVIAALDDFKVQAGFVDDEVLDLSRQSGLLPKNKTGDVLIEVDGDPTKAIAIEVKLDKGVKLGEIVNRDPLAKSDTAVSQLLETGANRGTTVNIIVFDEDSVDASVSKYCIEGIRYIPNIGFITVISTRRNDFRALALVYVLARDLVKSAPDVKEVDPNIIDQIVGRLILLLRDYSSIRKEAESIVKSARKIIVESEKALKLAEHTQEFLNEYLATGKLTHQTLLEFYEAKGVTDDMRVFEKSLS